MASGYFNLNGFSELLDVLVPIIRKKGRVRVITSPMLSRDDVELIKDSKDSQCLVEKLLIREFDNFQDFDLDKKRLLASLIKLGYIEIKIAYKESGIFHEKTGYMITEDNQKIAYIGSANMTFSGLYGNIESLSVYNGTDSLSTVLDMISYFEKLWNGHYSNVKIIELPQAIEKELLNFYDSSQSVDYLVDKIAMNSEIDVNLRDYQMKAIKEFEENKYKHFFEMATGTGKTFTALYAMQQVQKYKNNNLFTVVLLPLIDLMHQWNESAIKFGLDGSIYLIGGNASSKTPDAIFTEAMHKFLDNENVTIFAVYNSYQLHLATFLSNYKSNLADKLLIIVDEAHNITETLLELLPKASFRLGLSATPDRRSIQETRNILSYFRGEQYSETYKYSLKDAIERGYLSKYYYFPIFVHLSDEEYENYEKESRTIAILISSRDYEAEDKLNRAYQRRALIVKKSSSKIEKLETMLKEEEYDFENSVIYCGPGLNSDEEKLTDQITKMISNIGKYDVKKFTANTENRVQVLEDFKNNYYDTLVAIKCFDEGIDAPALSRIYILSSDNNLRQTIQRRGRVLRVSKETGKEYAEIYDFIAFPPPNIEYKNAKALLNNEIVRAEEYLDLAENKNKYTNLFKSIRKEAEIEKEEYYVFEDVS